MYWTEVSVTAVYLRGRRQHGSQLSGLSLSLNTGGPCKDQHGHFVKDSITVCTDSDGINMIKGSKLTQLCRRGSAATRRQTGTGNPS